MHILRRRISFSLFAYHFDIIISYIYRTSHQRCSVKECVHKNFMGKHLCWNLFLIKLQASGLALYEKRLQHRWFPVKFAQFLRTSVLQNIREQLLPHLIFRIVRRISNYFYFSYLFLVSMFLFPYKNPSGSKRNITPWIIVASMCEYLKFRKNGKLSWRRIVAFLQKKT